MIAGCSGRMRYAYWLFWQDQVCMLAVLAESGMHAWSFNTLRDCQNQTCSNDRGWLVYQEIGGGDKRFIGFCIYLHLKDLCSYLNV